MQYKKPEIMEKIRMYALDYYRENNRMPGIRAIAEGTGINRGSVQQYLVEMGKRGMIEYDGGIVSIRSAHAYTEAKATYNAGILGSIACGIPEDAEEHVEEYVPLPTSIFGEGELYILRAHGDSMIQAGIDDGDLVVIRKTATAHDGDIVVALVEEETTTLKRLFIDRENHRIRLHPENDRMEDIIVPSCRIQGVAVNVIKTLAR
ncbi:MAG: repressor LexA [Clostridia bacterium]|nr:repressor LexA [Clostridia bacterium]